MTIVDEHAPKVGVAPACRAVDVSRATWYRRRKNDRVRQVKPRRQPPRRLSDAERERIVNILCSDEFVDRSPRAVYAILYVVAKRVYPAGEGGFTSFNRSFPQSTVVFLSIPVNPTGQPNWRLSSYFIDGVECPYTGDAQDGQVLIDLEIAGNTNVLALKYKFYGSLQTPDFQAVSQD